MAAPYSLRGIEAKKKFVEDYPVRCLFHSVLFPGIQERCCCGDALEGEYFLFRYGDEENDCFYAGPACGLTLIQEARSLGKRIVVPDFFSPFALDARQQRNEQHHHDCGQNDDEDRLPENREMITAISLLLYLWRDNSEGALFCIRRDLLMRANRPPKDWEMRTLNKAIRKTRKHGGARTLREWLLVKCQDNNLRARTFHFLKLEHHMNSIGEVSLL